MSEASRYRLEARVTIYDGASPSYGRLELSESTSIPDVDFETVAALLQRFHAVLEEIRST